MEPWRAVPKTFLLLESQKSLKRNLQDKWTRHRTGRANHRGLQMPSEAGAAFQFVLLRKKNWPKFREASRKLRRHKARLYYIADWDRQDQREPFRHRPRGNQLRSSPPSRVYVKGENYKPTAIPITFRV